MNQILSLGKCGVWLNSRIMCILSYSTFAEVTMLLTAAGKTNNC